MRYRYSQWDGSQSRWSGFQLDAEDLMAELSHHLLNQGDLARALRLMMQRGIKSPMGEHIPGIQELLQKLRARRQEMLDRYDLSSAVESIHQRLQEIVDLERQGIQRRLNAARGRFQEAAATAPGDGLSPETEEHLLQVLERMAARNLDTLDNLPRDLGKALRQLSQYEFMEPEAKRQFDELIESLRQRAIESYGRGLSQQFRGLSPEQTSSLKEFLGELNRLLQERIEGGAPDYAAFRRRFPQAGLPPSLDDLIEDLQRRIAQTESLLDSLPRELREELESAMREMMRDPELQERFQSLTRNLDALAPLRQWRAEYPFQGQDDVSWEGAMQLLDRLQHMDDLEKALRRVQMGASPDEVDKDMVKQFLGEDACQGIEELRNLAERLEKAGYIRKRGGRYELTPKAMRKIGQRALLEVFACLKRGRLGRHPQHVQGRLGELTLDNRPYEFGDPFHLDLGGSLMNAVRRGGPGVPVRLQPEDLEVQRQATLTHTATVLMIDLSLSMAMRGNFLAAKKVALALDSLIRGQFPRDTLNIVGFSTYARELKPERLPYLNWDEADPYTNLQHGLMVARRLLAAQKATNRQIIIISDGEPTAHMEGGHLYLQYPPSPRTIQETLAEAKRCTQEGIVINTFMLDRSSYLMEFVNQLAKVNRGRVFYTTAENLGEYLLVDYLASKRKRITA
ncbi:MAG: VWA domain-containing protein [Chloroflexi bacterium]|nr:VWA domain-containing protein [Chloroflexota bacterium]